MAYNEKQIPTSSGLPIPSSFNAASDRFDPTYGAGNAPRVRIADGDDAAFGARDDAPSSGDLTGSFSLISLSKEMVELLRTLS